MRIVFFGLLLLGFGAFAYYVYNKQSFTSLLDTGKDLLGGGGTITPPVPLTPEEKAAAAYSEIVQLQAVQPNWPSLGFYIGALKGYYVLHGMTWSIDLENAATTYWNSLH